MSGAAFIGWAVEALIASTILMIFVLLCRKEAQRALGPQLAYWLWALPALRMAMPPLPASWRETAAAPLTAASETVLVLVEPILPAAAAADAAPFPWALLIGGAWVLGAVAFFAWHGLAHLSYVRRIVSPPARHAQLPDGTTLVESDEAVGPVAFGIFKRFVAVPSDFAERYDADERKLALAHELGHHARGDLIANWIGLALLACHWFNPVAWIAYRKFRADQEMANDARVLAALPAIERHAYACAIVKAAHGRAVTAACHLHTIDDLKGRLRMLKASRKSRRVAVAGAVGIAGLTVAGLGLTASGAAAEKIRTVAVTQVAAMAQATAPVPPSAPVPPAARPAEPAPVAARKRRVVIVEDGRTQTYEGAAADAYLAANPEPGRPGAAGEWRRGVTVRARDGRLQVLEAPGATIRLKGTPAPLPPLPPQPPVTVTVVPPLPPMPAVTVRTLDGKTIDATQVWPSGYRFGAPVTSVVSKECRGGDRRSFVRREMRDGQSRMVICSARIAQFAADQVKTGKRVALGSLIASRAAIASNRGLTDAQRAQALAGIDEARRDLERELRESKAD